MFVFPAPYVAAGGGSEVDLSFIGSNSSTANASAYTFTNQPIGDDDATHRTLVNAHATAVSQSIDNVTIGGSAAALHENLDAGTNRWTAICSRKFSGGTTATIVVNLTGGGVNCAIGVYRSVNETNSVPHDSFLVVDATNSPSETIDIPDGGFVMAASSYGVSSGSVAHAWTAGATENYDLTVETTTSFSGASASELAAETGRTISATRDGTVANGTFGAISWA